MACKLQLKPIAKPELSQKFCARPRCQLTSHSVGCLGQSGCLWPQLAGVQGRSEPPMRRILLTPESVQPLTAIQSPAPPPSREGFPSWHAHSICKGHRPWHQVALPETWHIAHGGGGGGCLSEGMGLPMAHVWMDAAETL